ncbi:MAG: hypothetical protein CVU24_08805 [Betaproteobacteria bacterium HGW-Betaproteobacteria-18]|nr:MAG: hypothetical protein CVU24_08805 [Betaproteobacteria bacterium HGW-Betaproteobacteria-18]
MKTTLPALTAPLGKWSLEKSLTRTLVMAVVVLIIVSAASIYILLAFIVDAGQVQHTHQVIEQAQTTLTKMIDVETGARGYVIVGTDPYLEPYQRGRASVMQDVARLRELVADNPRQQSAVKSIQALIERRLVVAEELIELRTTKGFAAAQTKMEGGAGLRLMDQLREASHQFIDTENVLLSTREREATSQAYRAVAGLGVLVTLVAVMILFVGRYVRAEVGLREQSRRLVESLNAELAQRAAALAAKNDDLKGFAYTVSHDLKAPLRGISGYAQELERRHKEGLSERAQFCISQIITASKNLDRLIEDLLTYSRLEAETPTLSEVNLTDLVQSILRDRSHTLTELGVEVSVQLPPLVLLTWERGLHQVLTNLIDNAIKYSRAAKPPRLNITAETLAEGVRVSVADNGIGFDMKYHDRIFGLFNRLVRASEFEGTGAGLAIVKKLLDKLGGSIRAESEPGAGATFFVDLPAATAAATPATLEPTS